MATYRVIVPNRIYDDKKNRRFWGWEEKQIEKGCRISEVAPERFNGQFCTGFNLIVPNGIKTSPLPIDLYVASWRIMPRQNQSVQPELAET